MVPWYNPLTWGKKSRSHEPSPEYREDGISKYDQNLLASLQKNHKKAIKTLNGVRTERLELDREVLKALEGSMNLTNEQLRAYVRAYRGLVIEAEEAVNSLEYATDAFRKHDDFVTSQIKRLTEKNDRARESAIHRP